MPALVFDGPFGYLNWEGDVGSIPKPEWEALQLGPLEKVRIQSDLDTLDFSLEQIALLEKHMTAWAANDERVAVIFQLSGVGLVTAVTLLSTIGDIARFPDAKSLVGYAGLGARVRDSGMTYQTGRITKAGRRDLRRSMVEADNHAIKAHPHWKAEFERLEKRKGRSKAVVAVARKLLVAVWHILTKVGADRHAQPQQVATSLFTLAHRMRVKNLPDGQSALEFTHNQLDLLGIGQEVTHIPWSSKRFKLPPSKSS